MNKYEQRSIANYNNKANDYENTFDGKFSAKFKQYLVNYIDLAEGCVLLDIACGNGRMLNDLSKKANIKGAGIDISEKMIEQAKRLNPTMDFKVSGCDKLPFCDNYFDVATVCVSFHHFPNVNAFAREACRVVKQGGMIYIAEVYLPTPLRYICNPFFKFSNAGDVKLYSPKQIVKIFESNGFYKKSVVVDGVMQIVALQKL